MTLDFIFWLVLFCREDVSFNIICLNVLKGIDQLNLLIWLKKNQLEIPLKGDIVKAFPGSITQKFRFDHLFSKI